MFFELWGHEVNPWDIYSIEARALGYHTYSHVKRGDAWIIACKLVDCYYPRGKA